MRRPAVVCILALAVVSMAAMTYCTAEVMGWWAPLVVLLPSPVFGAGIAATYAAIAKP